MNNLRLIIDYIYKKGHNSLFKIDSYLRVLNFFFLFLQIRFTIPNTPRYAEDRQINVPISQIKCFYIIALC